MSVRHLRFTVAVCAATFALQAAQPADPGANYLGINVWFNNDYNGANTFADIMKHSREWCQYNWNNGAAAMDSLGWPTEDCSNVIFGRGNPLGTYRLLFEGSATSVGVMWTGGSVSNLQYNTGTNTSTADVTITNNSTGGLRFQGTKRTAASATNSGLRNVRLYRPGYPTDGSVVYTSEWLAIMRKFHAIRFMDWVRTNDNPVVSWSQRQTPLMATRPNLTVDGHAGPAGLAMEHFIQLCNEVNADLWMNFPCMADSDYVRKTAQLILYGSDGTNPYTGPQASPVYPPLNANLKVCLEWANEIWNTAGGFMCYRWIKEKTDAILAAPGTPHPIIYDGANDQYRAIARFTAWKTAEASRIFRQVYGDAAMMTRVRPMLMGQLGGNWCNPAQLPFLDGYYATYRPAGDPYPNTDPRPVSYYLYASGGSSYYGVNTWDPSPSVFFGAGNYPEAGFATAVGNDAVWGGNYGLKRISYEGGMGLDGSWAATDTQKLALINDPRMKDLTVAYHDVWSQCGGDLAVYYCAVGPVNWEFTDAVTNPNSPKLQAIDKLRDTLSRADATLGGVAPTTVVARTIRDAGVGAGVGTFWNGTVSTEDVVSGIDVGEWIAMPVSAPADGWYLVSARCAAGSTAARATLWLNGVSVDTFAFAGTANTLMNSPAAPVQLKRGLNVVRFQPSVNQWSLRSITLVVDTSVGVARHAAVAVATRELTLRSAGGAVLGRLAGLPKAAVAYAVYGVSGRRICGGKLTAGATSLVLPAGASGTYVLRVQAAQGAALERVFRM